MGANQSRGALHKLKVRGEGFIERRGEHGREVADGGTAEVGGAQAALDLLLGLHPGLPHEFHRRRGNVRLLRDGLLWRVFNRRALRHDVPPLGAATRSLQPASHVSAACHQAVQHGGRHLCRSTAMRALA